MPTNENAAQQQANAALSEGVDMPPNLVTFVARWDLVSQQISEIKVQIAATQKEDPTMDVTYLWSRMSELKTILKGYDASISA